MAAQGKLVLLVDDDVDFVSVNRMTLEKAGYRVVSAHTGHDGMQLAVDNPIDVAVLDVMMGTPDEGFELARKMRNDERTKKIPLIMLTSINDDLRQKRLPTFSNRDRDEAWLPVDRFVEKPLTPQRLLSLVKDLTA